MLHVEPTQRQDVPILARLVNHYADLDVMLHRDPQSIAASLDQWVTAAEYDPLDSSARHVLGGASLTHLTEELAEVRSLVVRPEAQDRGVGKAVVKAIVDMARRTGYQQICALTLVPGFFGRLGFSRVSMENISPKVWVDCVHCPKNQRCDEIAMILDLVPNPVVRDYSHLDIRMPVRAAVEADFTV